MLTRMKRLGVLALAGTLMTVGYAGDCDGGYGDLLLDYAYGYGYDEVIVYDDAYYYDDYYYDDVYYDDCWDCYDDGWWFW